LLPFFIFVKKEKMKIALLGYGKMGKEIENIALNRNHTIVLKIDINNSSELTIENLQKADVAIDFSIPASAHENIMKCFSANVPIVCGTTGWLEKYQQVVDYCNQNKKTFFYASNYSVGVNIFFKLNKYLAEIMNKFQAYNPSMTEIHHIHKLDAPSGTAITLAEGMIEKIDRKERWELNAESSGQNLKIEALREGEVPGTHIIKYDSPVDYIEIKHLAKSRQGFALGAVLAAEYIKDKTGFFSMEHLMNDNKTK
jgi:4-hydroxy-tetrahydrodipicolinate reductase